MRIEDVLSRHGNPTTETLPGAQLKILEVNPVLQNGPQCGLVALSMASQLLGVEAKSIAEILEMAKMLGFTVQGEMFSGEWLKKLASSLWPLRSEVISIPEPCAIVKLLESGAAVLVAYDCAKNHEPTMRNGFGAHWALLVGYLYVEPECSTVREASNVVVTDESAFYVFAYHGKSRHMGLWSYLDLRRSSFNLFEAGPSRQAPDYILPDSGLAELRGKCVVLRNDLMSKV
ncbi:hypothetical protein Q1695_003436 [Nippostrongylus brasiliensis]|nr:hypothetical protein Q1695_003436 [Nippostrongylus brasiliensis]